MISCYELELVCGQCNKTELYQIPFGMEWQDFCRKNTCKNCECGNFLERVEELDPLL